MFIYLPQMLCANICTCLHYRVGRQNGWYEKLPVPTYHSLNELKESRCETRFKNEVSAKAGSLFKLATCFISYCQIIYYWK